MAEQHTPSEQPPSRGDEQFPEEQRRAVADDEISLIDLWLVLVRRRRWLFGIALTVFALGSAYGLLQKPSQAHTTTLELGTFVQFREEALEREPLISIHAMQSQLKRVAIPKLQRRFEAEHEASAPSVEIEHIEDSQQLILESSVPEAQSSQVEDLHRSLKEWFISQQEPLFEERRDQIKRQLNQIKENRASELSGIGEDIEATRAELETVQARQQEAREERQELQEKLDSQEDSLSAERLSVQLEGYLQGIRTANTQVRELRERLSDLRRERREVRQSLAEEQSLLEDRLDGLQPPRAISLATPGETQGAKSGLIAALAAVLGGMLGIFGAFFREFLAHAQAAAQSESIAP
ncbi:MAG: hypothetical protein ACLFSJ_06215 [Halorhodospira sp.]